MSELEKNQSEEEVRTEPIIGEFKPKRKFLNFVYPKKMLKLF
jgi:hypothetical protein